MSFLDQTFRPVGSTRRDPVLIALWVSLILLALIWIAPFVFIVFTSLKTTAEVMGSSAFAPPMTMATENYSSAWGRGDFSTTAFNSAIISAIKVPLGLFLSAMAAYALARIEMPLRKVAFVLEYEFDSAWMTRAAGPVFSRIGDTLLDAFVERALTLPVAAAPAVLELSPPDTVRRWKARPLPADTTAYACDALEANEPRIITPALDQPFA